ncbi:MAG: HAMP domain-containing histidine kinase [Planctomycetes bacterium]|nr:HAMP domain-containing histidine kinase [Planctomycetota bacterium]
MARIRTQSTRPQDNSTDAPKGERNGAGRPSLAEREVAHRTRWLITSRWFAAIGVLVFPLAAHYGFGVGFSLRPVVVTSVSIAIYNAVFLFCYRRLSVRREGRFRALVIFANVQIFVDLLVLTVLIHYTGGIENPFLFFYIFHMIIASILLTRFQAYLQATCASILFAGLALLEYHGTIPHVDLGNYLLASYHGRLQVVAGICVALVSSLYLSVHMASSIANSLRRNQAELEEAYRNLEALNARRSVFFREASHELRAPLVAMRSCLDVVLGEHVGTINERQRDMVERTHNRIDYLLELVSDLLQLSWLRATTQLVKIENVDLAETAADVIDLLTENAAEANVTVTTDIESVDVEGDKSAFRQMLMNLIGNAIKYNRRGGRVTVTGRAAKSRFILEVADTGIGVEAEDHGKIFEEFYRSPKARETVRIGTGVGLTIVRRVVDMHHGEIAVESEPGKGTTFRVRLPLDQP